MAQIASASQTAKDRRRPVVASTDETAASISPAMQRIVSLLRAKTPLSPKEIARDAFIALTTLEGGGYLKKMKGLGLIRIEGWLKNHNGFTTPLYALGRGTDCPRPKFASIDRDSRGMAKIVAILNTRSKLDYREIAKLAGISANTIKNAKYMDSLLAQGRVHVAAWRRGRNGHLYPLFNAGADESADRPEQLSRQEIMQRHRTRQKILSGKATAFDCQLKSLPLAGPPVTP